MVIERFMKISKHVTLLYLLFIVVTNDLPERHLLVLSVAELLAELLLLSLEVFELILRALAGLPLGISAARCAHC